MIPRRGLTNGVLQAPLSGEKLIRSLFKNNEQGVWYDPSDLSTLFQDSAGTTPVTAVGQPVGRMLDKSGRSNHATQATAASRPVLSARVNLLTKTDQLSNAIWSKLAAGTGVAPVVTDNFGVAPDGTTTATRVQLSVGSGTTSSDISYIAQAATAAIGLGSIWLKTNDGSSKTIGFRPAKATAQALTVTGTWQLFTAPADGYANYQILLYGTYSSSSADILMWHPQLETGTLSTRYQYVNTSTDYDTIGFPMYLSCDGVDDGMATPNIDFSGTNKVTIWAGVRKLSDAAIGCLLELGTGASFSATSFTILAPDAAAATSYKLTDYATTTANTHAATNFAAPTSNIVTGVIDNAATTQATQTSIYINSVRSLSANANSLNGDVFLLNAVLYLFRRAGASLPFNGNFYGLVIRGATSSPKQISQVEKYLALKTGVTL